MSTLKAIVIYESKFGFAKGIAEFIAEKLRQQGTQAEVRQVDAVHNHNPGDYDAFVIGSAVFYMERWMKEATEFVTENRGVLAGRPVWLFSSGPLGTNTKDARGSRETCAPYWNQRKSPSSERPSTPATTGFSLEGWTVASLGSHIG